VYSLQRENMDSEDIPKTGRGAKLSYALPDASEEYMRLKDSHEDASARLPTDWSVRSHRVDAEILRPELQLAIAL